MQLTEKVESLRKEKKSLENALSKAEDKVKQLEKAQQQRRGGYVIAASEPTSAAGEARAEKLYELERGRNDVSKLYV